MQKSLVFPQEIENEIEQYESPPIFDPHMSVKERAFAIIEQKKIEQVRRLKCWSFIGASGRAHSVCLFQK